MVRLLNIFLTIDFLSIGRCSGDINTYTKNRLNPLRTLSPRASFSYIINNQMEYFGISGELLQNYLFTNAWVQRQHRNTKQYCKT